jgi:hypothetical protein
MQSDITLGACYNGYGQPLKFLVVGQFEFFEAQLTNSPPTSMVLGIPIIVYEFGANGVR